MIRKVSRENRARMPSFNEEEEQASAGAVAPRQASMEEEFPEDPGAEPAQDLRQAQIKQEATLKAKYPGLKTKGASSFLAQRRLQRGGHKFFDSGDYNLVKGKKPGLSGASARASKTKPEKEKKERGPVTMEELGNDFATADAIISRRMALFRTKSESHAEERAQFPSGRTTRSGSMFVSGSGTRLNQAPGGMRRGSMFPMMTHPTGSEDALPPPEEMLQRRRQSMIPAIPSKLAL